MLPYFLSLAAAAAGWFLEGRYSIMRDGFATIKSWFEDPLP